MIDSNRQHSSAWSRAGKVLALSFALVSTSCTTLYLADYSVGGVSGEESRLAPSQVWSRPAPSTVWDAGVADLEVVGHNHRSPIGFIGLLMIPFVPVPGPTGGNGPFGVSLQVHPHEADLDLNVSGATLLLSNGWEVKPARFAALPGVSDCVLWGDHDAQTAAGQTVVLPAGKTTCVALFFDVVPPDPREEFALELRDAFPAHPSLGARVEFRHERRWVYTPFHDLQ